MSLAVNPIQPFLRQGTIPQDAIDDLPRLIGQHTKLFANGYDFERGQIVNTWNWFAFIVPYFWCWYRKMPEAAMAILALEVVLVYVLPTFGASAFAVMVGLLALHIFYGLVGIGYYVGNSLLRVKAIQAATSNQAERDLAYQRFGGTSLPMVAVGLVVHMLASIALMTLVEEGRLGSVLVPSFPTNAQQVETT